MLHGKAGTAVDGCGNAVASQVPLFLLFFFDFCAPAVLFCVTLLLLQNSRGGQISWGHHRHRQQQQQQQQQQQPPSTATMCSSGLEAATSRALSRGGGGASSGSGVLLLRVCQLAPMTWTWITDLQWQRQQQVCRRCHPSTAMQSLLAAAHPPVLSCLSCHSCWLRCQGCYLSGAVQCWAVLLLLLLRGRHWQRTALL